MKNKLLFKLFEIIALIIHFFPSRRKCFYDVVIVKVDALGDYILWIDALSAYRKKYKGKKVLLVCEDLNKPLAEIEPFFTNVWGFNCSKFENSFFYFLSFVKKLKRVSANTVIFPVWQRPRIGDILVYLISSYKKITMQSAETPGLMSRLYDKQYNLLVSKPDSNSELIAIEHFTKHVVSEDYIYGKSILTINDSHYKVPDKNYIVVSLSASIPQKTWPVVFFSEVVNDIILNTNYIIVLSGAGEIDQQKATLILSSSPDKSRLLDLVGKTSVVELVVLISKASLVIGNDSAAVHIAAATHVPSLCLMHGAHFGRFLPYPTNMPNKEFHPKVLYYNMDCYGCGYKCNRIHNGVFECLYLVEPSVVSNTAIDMLKR